MKIPSFHWWRTVFFLIPAISVYTVVLGALSIGFSPFDRRGVFAHGCARVWAWLILATTRVEVHVSGLERLRRDVTYVFVSNHQSIYDIPIIFASVPFQLRIIAKESLGRFPVLGWHLRWTGHLLVNRSRPGTNIGRRVSKLLRDGLSLIVFPEGTRSVDGRVGVFKRGVFLLSVEASLPIVPVAVVGSRHVMRKGRLMTCPGEVRLTIHEPISTASLAAADARRLADRAWEIVRASVESLDPDLAPPEGVPTADV